MGQKAVQNDLSRFDLWDFCRIGGQLSSSTVDFLFDRLLSDHNVCVVKGVEWDLFGSRNKKSESTVRIRGTMRVELFCVHCGEPIDSSVPIERNWVLARSEQEAEDYDEDDLGEQDDVVACEGYVDIQQWVEDELLLSLPMLPAHDYECAESASAAKQDFEFNQEALQEPLETHKPFANLDQLIKKPKN